MSQHTKQGDTASRDALKKNGHLSIDPKKTTPLSLLLMSVRREKYVRGFNHELEDMSYPESYRLLNEISDAEEASRVSARCSARTGTSLKIGGAGRAEQENYLAKV